MRLLTVLCVVGLCAFAAVRGWSIVQFAEARAQALARQIPTDAVRSWVGARGLTSAALQASLTRIPAATDQDAPRKRADDLAALLAVRPLSSTDWLSLAGMQLVAARPYEKVLAGLAMSSLTGPNEGAVMVQRAIFGLLQWEALPADARRRTIGDLAEAARAGAIGDGATTVAENVLRAKSSETREQIAGLLRAERVSAAALARMGL
jgi:hypothetical protein